MHLRRCLLHLSIVFYTLDYTPPDVGSRWPVGSWEDPACSGQTPFAGQLPVDIAVAAAASALAGSRCLAAHKRSD